MKPDLEEKLLLKYSHLFEPEEIRSDETKSCMYFGFECGDGWYDLLDKMMQEISDLRVEGFLFSQIKEKFGTLTVYSYNSTDEIDFIIDKYSNLSEITCEVCGKPGVLYTTGWHYVGCDEHKEG